MTSNGEFRGSIFNLDTTPNPGIGAEASSNDLDFVSGKSGNGTLLNGPSDTSKASSAGFVWPSAQTTSGQNSDILNTSFASQQQQPNTDFANKEEKRSEPVNIFAGIKSPFGPSNNNVPQETKSDVFRGLTGTASQSSQHNPNDNPFASSIAQFRKDAEARYKAEDAGQLANTSTDSPSSSALQPPSQANVFPSDAMQTSPDTTPKKPTASSSSPFQFIMKPTQSTNASNENQPNATSSSSSLFSRISKPTSDSPTSTLFGAVPPNGSSKPPPDLFSTSTITSSTPLSSVQGGVKVAAKEYMTSARDEPTSFGNPPGISFTTSQSPVNGNRDTLHFSKDLSGPFQTTLVKPIETQNNEESGSQRAETPDEFFSAQGVGNKQQIEENLPQPPNWYGEADHNSICRGWRFRGLAAGLHSYVSKVADKVNVQHLEEYVKSKEQAIQDAGVGAVQSVLPQKRRHASEVEDTPRPTTKQKRHKTDMSEPHDEPLNRVRPSRTDLGLQGTPKSQTSSLFSSIVDSNKASGSNTQNTIAKEAQNGKIDGSSIFSPVNTSALHNTFGSHADGGLSSTGGNHISSISGPSVSASTEPEAKTANVTYPSLGRAPSGHVTGESQDTTRSLPIDQAVAQPIKPPQFETKNATNFMSQFGDRSKEWEAKMKSKRKAEEFDSDEDNEEEWERRYAEEQRLKKQKIEEAAKGSKGFTPTTSIQSQISPSRQDKGAHDQQGIFGANKSYPNGPASSEGMYSEEKKDRQLKAGHKSGSVLDNAGNPFSAPSGTNIFGFLSKTTPEKEPEDSDEAEVDGEEDSGESVKEPLASSQPLSGSLFDRIPKPGATSTHDDSSTNHTWKADSPIKFGNPSSSLPSISVSKDTPSQTSASNLFGSSVTSSSASSKPGSSLFSNLAAGQNANSGAPNFAFGPAKGAHTGLGHLSNNTSRATSPGATTGESATESATEGAEENTESEPQTNFSSHRAGEENEETIHEVRAKALRYEDNDWQSKGVGPLRVLEDRVTKKRRVILRVDPGGSIVINSDFSKEMAYEHVGSSTVRCFLAGQNGVVSMWHIRVKSNDQAADLAKVFNESKKHLS